MTGKIFTDAVAPLGSLLGQSLHRHSLVFEEAEGASGEIRGRGRRGEGASAFDLNPK